LADGHVSTCTRQRRCGITVALLAVVVGRTTDLAIPALAWGTVRASPPPALPFLPTLPLVALDVGVGHVTIMADIDMTRGGWQSGDLDLFVAFGAPGMPRAIDAHLISTDGGSGPGTGEPVVAELVARRPPGAFALLGPTLMAGVVLHLREAAFRRATSGGVAHLRLRALHELPQVDPLGGQEVVVRLGSEGGAPVALGRIVVRASDGAPVIRRAEARLCGPEADPFPLAISVDGASAQTARKVAPELAVRHLTDDLCVRFWTS
jgi:hypothetical protein